MKHHFDFLIEEEKDSLKTVLRFYPRQSHVHGFYESSPTEWESVYKTYMTFSILRYYRDSEDEPYEVPFTLFSYFADEGEGLRILREVLKELLSENAKEEYEIIPFGDGVDWEIYKLKRNKDYYVFNMINDFTGECYRFHLKTNQIQDFYKVLNEFLEYMLQHSESI